MLIFFDESFRTGRWRHRFGVLAGVAIPEELFGKVITDVYSLKRSSFGEEFAKERELKGAKLLKSKNFRVAEAGRGSAELEFVRDLLRYIVRQKLRTFGVISFDTDLGTFKCNDPLRLEPTYRILFERIDNFMKAEFPHKRAKIIFDDVDYGTNKNRAASIANFFNRTPVGRGYDSIIRVPFFAIFQAQNVGLELADVVTACYGMRFEGNQRIAAHWRILKKSLYYYKLGERWYSSMKVFKP